METRFKTLRLEYQDALKDQNHTAKFTQEDLSKSFEDMKFYISREKIGKLETGDHGVLISKEIIIAYCNFFHVSADWLLGLSETRYTKGDISFASKTIGISEIAINKLKDFSLTEKSILNLLIENGAIHFVLTAVYDYFPNQFNESDRAIVDEVGFKFNRFLSMETLQKFLDYVHSDQRFSNIMFENQSKEFKNNITSNVAQILIENLSPEEYEKYRKAGKKHGFFFPEPKKEGN